MSLSTTPDLPLLRIFYHLPMEDLLFRSNLVCRRWAKMKPEACAQRRLVTIFDINRDFQFDSHQHDPFAIPFVSDLDDDEHNERSLITLPSRFDPYECEWSRVDVQRLRPEKINQFMVKWLPNITSLVVVQNQLNQWLPELLDNFKNNLISLKLLFPCTRIFEPIVEMTPAYGNRLFGCINSMPKLKHLTFLFQNCETINERNPDGAIKYAIDLPIVSQLEEFNFHLNGSLDSVWQSLCKYVSIDNDRLKRIGLLDWPSEQMLLTLDPQLAAKFTHLCLLHYPNPDGPLNLEPFTNLTTVYLNHWDIYDSSHAASYYFGPLTKLPRLLHLSLCIDIEYFEHLPVDPDAIQQFQLVSVQVLSLTLNSNRHTDLDLCFSIISQLLPVLRVVSIRFDWYKCKLCDIGPDYYFVNDHFEDCARETVRPLADFRDNLERPLSRIEVSVLENGFYRVWSIEELL